MHKLRTLLAACALGLVITGAAHAQATTSQTINLANQLHSVEAANTIGQAAVNPMTYLSLHGGAMVSPRGAGLVGVDFSLPTASLGNGWHGRIDADVIIKANFAGVDTVVPVTFDQVYYSPTGSGHNVYFGGGLGALFGGNTVFDGKLILGSEFTSRLGGELNVHFNEHDTLLTLFVRVHL